MDSASYIVCTSPRSGSTLLCRMLAATGIAGDPESLFFLPSLEIWMTRLGVSPGPATERELLQIIMQAALRTGRGGTAMFGLRQQRQSFEFLCQKLAILHPSATNDRDRIERTFGPVQFIYLKRQDKVEQAVSFLKAQQTGLWHVAADGSEWERTAPPRAPVYDASAIADHIRILDAYDLAWSDWFDREKIKPLCLSYDELSDAPVATLHRVLECLGLDPQSANVTAPEVRRMADAASRDWVARFRAEPAHR